MKFELKSLKVIICVTFYSAIAFAQAGELDSTFGTDGKVTTAVGTSFAGAYSVAVQPDGKIVAGGYSFNGIDDDFAALRYNTDGSLDTSFGTGGKAITDFDQSEDVGRSLVIQSDGKVVVAGFINNGTIQEFALARYNFDGVLDNTFGTNGKVTTAIGTMDAAYAIAIQTDGKIVVAGFTSSGVDEEFALVRYKADGSLDAGFGSDGKVITELGSGDNAVRSIALQSDGKIVAAGESFNGTNEDFSLLRYNADGNLDNSFGTDGKVITEIGLYDDWLESVALQSDGKIITTGYTYNAASADIALLRYNINGTLDSSFGTEGKVNTPVGNGNDYGYSVAIQPDGKIIVAGSISSVPYNYFGLIRYDSYGALDNNFGSGGIVTTTVGMGFAGAYSTTMQSDGKIVAAGYSSESAGNVFALARYLSGLNVGILNFASSQTLPLIYPNPIQQTEQLQYALTNDEVLTLRLYDVNGRLMKDFFANKKRTAGEHHEELNFGNLAAGNYLLTLSNGSQQVSVKIMKQ